MRQWRSLSQSEQTDILAYELARAKDREEQITERAQAAGKAMLVTDFLLLDIWRNM